MKLKYNPNVPRKAVKKFHEETGRNEEAYREKNNVTLVRRITDSPNVDDIVHFIDSTLTLHYDSSFVLRSVDVISPWNDVAKTRFAQFDEFLRSL